MPSMGPALFDDEHETVVGQRVAVGVRQQEAARGRGVAEREHRHRAAIGQHSRLLPVLTADIRPPDEVGAVLPDVADRHRKLPTELPIHSNRVLVCPRRVRVWIELQVPFESTTVTIAGVAAGRSDRSRPSWSARLRDAIGLSSPVSTP